jgi:saccharopepsin
MKNGLLLTAAALLGTASAGVHKMKLKKIPLSEQLVSDLPAYFRFEGASDISHLLTHE